MGCLGVAFRSSGVKIHLAMSVAEKIIVFITMFGALVIVVLGSVVINRTLALEDASTPVTCIVQPSDVIHETRRMQCLEGSVEVSCFVTGGNLSDTVRVNLVYPALRATDGYGNLACKSSTSDRKDWEPSTGSQFTARAWLNRPHEVRGYITPYNLEAWGTGIALALVFLLVMGCSVLFGSKWCDDCD